VTPRQNKGVETGDIDFLRQFVGKMVFGFWFLVFGFWFLVCYAAT